MQYECHPLDPVISVTGLVNAACYKLPKNYTQPGEYHDCWELVYVDRGTVQVTAGTAIYELHAEEMAFHCPNEFHNLRPAGEESATVIIIAFQSVSPMMGALEQQILKLSTTEKQCLSSIVKEAETTFAHFNNVPPWVDLQLREDAPYGSQQVIRNLLEYFLILIRRRRDGIQIVSRALSSNQLHHHARIAAQIREDIHLHFREKLTLDLLAARHGISTSQLKRIFREQTGSSVLAYLTAFRIGEAKRLIQESNLNFSQIAPAVGYENIYYFSTAFKKHTGMTPTEYARSLIP